MKDPTNLVKETRRPGPRRLRQIAIAAVLGAILGAGGSLLFTFGFYAGDHGELHRVRGTSRAPCMDREVRSSIVADEWQRRADALALSSAHVRLVPTLRDGRAIGFKIFAIEEGSLPELIGLRNGDTLTSIQGLPLTDTALAVEVLKNLTAGSPEVITIDGERRGCPVKFIVTIEA